MTDIWCLDGRRFSTAALRRLGVAAGNEGAVGAQLLIAVPPAVDPAFDAYVADGTVVSEGAVAQVRWAVHDRPVDEVKRELKGRMASRRWEREIAGVWVDGILMQTDRDSRATMASIPAWSDGEMWKDGQGLFRSLTVSQFESARSAIAAHVRACFAREAELAAMIDTATSVEELRALPVTEGWP